MINPVDKASKLFEIMSQSSDPESIRVTKDLYERAKKVSLMSSLKDNDGIKFLVEHFSTAIKNINAALLVSDSEELPDRLRDRLVDRKKDLVQFLGLFDINGKEMKAIEEQVDYELEQFN